MHAQERTVVLGREQILSLIFSATENHQKECFGYLFGHLRRGKEYRVIAARQCARMIERKKGCLRQSRRAGEQIWKFMKVSARLFPYLGDFHSHPITSLYHAAYGLSDEDLGNIFDHDRICVVITLVRRGNRALEWCLKDHRTRLRGSYGDFDFHILAYGPLRTSEDKLARDERKLPRVQRLRLSVSRWTFRAFNRAIKKL